MQPTYRPTPQININGEKSNKKNSQKIKNKNKRNKISQNNYKHTSTHLGHIKEAKDRKKDSIYVPSPVIQTSL